MVVVVVVGTQVGVGSKLVEVEVSLEQVVVVAVAAGAVAVAAAVAPAVAAAAAAKVAEAAPKLPPTEFAAIVSHSSCPGCPCLALQPHGCRPGTTTAKASWSFSSLCLPT